MKSGISTRLSVYDRRRLLICRSVEVRTATLCENIMAGLMALDVGTPLPPCVALSSLSSCGSEPKRMSVTLRSFFCDVCEEGEVSCSLA